MRSQKIRGKEEGGAAGQEGDKNPCDGRRKIADGWGKKRSD